MMATLNRYPSLRGMLFDQSHVLERAAGTSGLRGSKAAVKCTLVASLKRFRLGRTPTACVTFCTIGPAIYA